MIYTDETHLVADSLVELHKFAKEIGLKRCYFEGLKKGHPHYDLKNWKGKKLWCGDSKMYYLDKAIAAGAIIKDRRVILLISQDSIKIKYQTKIKF